MNIRTVVPVVVLLLVFSVIRAGAGSLSAEDTTKIKQVHSKYEAAWLKGDADGVRALFTEDCVLLPPHGDKPRVGQKGLNEYWFPPNAPPTQITKLVVTPQSIGGDGEIAYVWGTDEVAWTTVQNGKTASASHKGMFLNILRKQADGEWKMSHHMWDDPIAAPDAKVDAIEASWSPDGKHIVVNNKTDHEIWMLDSDGSNAQQITHSAAPGTHWYPMMSPDGKHIAFTAYRDGKMRLYVVNADGTGERDMGIVTSLRDQDPTRVSWSPDGSRLLYTSSRNGSAEIYMANVDGTGDTSVTKGLGGVWAPDGKSIAYSARRDTLEHWQLFVAHADGSGERQVTTTERGSDFDISWTRDGKSLVFLTVRPGPPGMMDGKWPKQFNKIATINVDGSGFRNLTDTDDRVYEPSLSPDGQQILYFRQERTADGRVARNLFTVMSLDGSNARVIF